MTLKQYAELELGDVLRSHHWLYVVSGFTEDSSAPIVECLQSGGYTTMTRRVIKDFKVIKKLSEHEANKIGLTLIKREKVFSLWKNALKSKG